jgi:lysophospholipase L1-like esterase
MRFGIGLAESRRISTGALFDTEAGNTFSELLYTPNAAVTVTDSQVALNSAGAIDVPMTIPAPDGVNPLYFCFTDWTMDATFTVTSFPAAGTTGIFAAARDYIPASLDVMYGMRIASVGYSAAAALMSSIAGNAILEHTYTQDPIPATIRVRYRHDRENNQVVHTVNVNGGADIELTEPYGVGSLTAPTSFLAGVLRPQQGVLTCTKMKLTAAYPNARFAFLGDSLTLWPGTGYAWLLKALYPDEVLIEAASGSTTENWTGIVHSAVAMMPRWAFVCLGTNDFITARSLVDIQADYADILAALEAADITPIIISSPPINNADVVTFNTWLAGLGKRYIDIYSTLKNPANNALDAAYDSGDGVHWNDDGHIAVKNIIDAYITAQGL